MGLRRGYRVTIQLRIILLRINTACLLVVKNEKELLTKKCQEFFLCPQRQALADVWSMCPNLLFKKKFVIIFIENEKRIFPILSGEANLFAFSFVP